MFLPKKYIIIKLKIHMSKIDDLRTRFYKINKLVFQRIVNSDTTPTKKYVEYMLKMWENNNNKNITIDMLIKKVIMFEELLSYIENKDIYSRVYKDFNFLSNVVNDAENKKNDNMFKRDEHVNIIIENDKFILLSPITYEGSLKYGAGTKWCTASTSTNQSYIEYTRSGILCYLINKSNVINKNFEKIGVYIPNIDEVLVSGIKLYNTIDNEVTVKTLLTNGWLIEDLTLIFSKARFYGVERSLIKKSEETIQHGIKLISSLKIDDIFNSIKYVESQKLINLDEEKVIINDFINQLKTKLNHFISP